MTDTLTTFAFRLPAPARLWTVNSERRMHWARRAELVKAWRHAAKIYARYEHVPRYEWVEIEACIAQASGVPADPGAHYPVVKAVVDGLVDAGIIEGDDKTHVRSIVQHAPIKENVEAVTLVLRGELRQ